MYSSYAPSFLLGQAENSRKHRQTFMLKEIVARIQVKIKGILLKSRNLFKSIRDYILKGAKHLTAYTKSQKLIIV